MIIGLVVFYFGKRSLKEKGLPPDMDLLTKPPLKFIKTEWVIYDSVLLLMPAIVFLFHSYELMDYIMFGLGGAAIIYVLFISFQLEVVARNKLFAGLILIVFSTAFWAFYEQNSGSLNLFAMRNVNMNFMGLDLPPLSVNNFLPPGWVIILTFLFAWLWPWLNKKGKEPSTPMKFSFAFILMGIGFYVFYLACKTNTGTGLIPLWAFIAGYFFIISGELCITNRLIYGYKTIAGKSSVNDDGHLVFCNRHRGISCWKNWFDDECTCRIAK